MGMDTRMDLMALWAHNFLWHRPKRKEGSLRAVAIERRGRVVRTPASYSGGPGLNLGLEIGYTDWEILWFSSVPPGKYLNVTLKLGHGRFFDTFSNSSFSYHWFIQRYLV
jgi:hypothetical protein